MPKTIQRNDYAQKHVKIMHRQEMADFNKVTVPDNKVEDIKKWIRPFESEPKIRLISEDIRRPPTEITNHRPDPRNDQTNRPISRFYFTLPF